MQSINNQPPEKRIDHELGMVDVQEVFWTIQGEGPYGGSPAVFIRLAGCNIQCPGCDTDYTSKRMVRACCVLAEEAATYFEHYQVANDFPSLVVITGGEPFRQTALTKLVRELLSRKLTVQIETNGTQYLPDFPHGEVCIVCSPKTPMINPAIPIDAYKYVLDADHVDPEDGLPTAVLGLNLPPARPFKSDLLKGVPVFVQPADERDPEKNKRNTDAVVASCMKYGYRINLQTHKLLGLP